MSDLQEMSDLRKMINPKVGSYNITTINGDFIAGDYIRIRLDGTPVTAYERKIPNYGTVQIYDPNLTDEEIKASIGASLQLAQLGYQERCRTQGCNCRKNT